MYGCFVRPKKLGRNNNVTVLPTNLSKQIHTKFYCDYLFTYCFISNQKKFASQGLAQDLIRLRTITELSTVIILDSPFGF